MGTSMWQTALGGRSLSLSVNPGVGLSSAEPGGNSCRKQHQDISHVPGEWLPPVCSVSLTASLQALQSSEDWCVLLWKVRGLLSPVEQGYLL